jgi:predicted CXXCH cytochrome family protein
MRHRSSRTFEKSETPETSRPVSIKPARNGRVRKYILLTLIAILAFGGLVFADWWIAIPENEQASYVGGKSCVDCHATQASLWHGSYHDLAMDPATADTVLGNFNNAEITHFGMTSRMFRRHGKFMVHTEGPDGALADFEVKYVFGVSPLQQYLVEFDRPADAKPHEIARLQTLPISWDTKNKKWFFLQPPDVAERVLPGDDLHWTGIAQRWNNMCGDCHTTNYQKNFDVASKTYHTTFTEMDVNCEACHGPGSFHVRLASAKSFFWDRKRGYGLAKLKGANPQVQIETCAPCHSMRRITEPGYRAGEPYLDYFVNELLHGHLYHADGQIQEEVYEYGSFTQSKMYQKGIRCSDCHDPHSTKVKFEGNKLCTSCHQHPAGKYDAPSHHHHDPNREGASCTACHMPKKTYMAVDPRLDHSLRVPRPDISVQLGTPNACSGCHLDKGGLPGERAAQLGEYANWITAARQGDSAVKDALRSVDEWAAKQVEQWYGAKPNAPKHFALALNAARQGDANAEQQLIRHAKDRSLTAMVRATCGFELGQYPTYAAEQASIQLLQDAEPLVRLSAMTNLERLPDEELVRRISPLLNDPIRSVRAEAGRVLARVNLRFLSGPQRTAREKAIEEYKHGLTANNDRAIGHLGLGVLAEQLGNSTEARRAYETAIEVEPSAAGPRANLAALLEQSLATTSDEAEGKKLLDTIARLRREELELLARDAKFVPQNATVRYRYGLSLYLHGRLDEAEKELLEAARLSPNTPDFVLAVALLYQKQNRLDLAIEYTKRVVELRPDDASYQQLLQELRQTRR